MVRTRAQTLRSLRSAEKTLKKALKKNFTVDRKTRRANMRIRKKASKQLKSLHKKIDPF